MKGKHFPKKGGVCSVALRLLVKLSSTFVLLPTGPTCLLSYRCASYPVCYVPEYPAMSLIGVLAGILGMNRLFGRLEERAGRPALE
jgi:hypothetical protein